nr:MAG TPA: head closure knob [Caudoviricetes sp.]
MKVRRAMMVQLQNPDRLTQLIVFGTINDQDYDINGVLKTTFVPIGNPTLCGLWSLTTSQMIQQTGNQSTNTLIVVVHHRPSWEKITHARLNNIAYKISNVNQDPYRNQTAYDLLTLTKVGENDG